MSEYLYNRDVDTGCVNYGSWNTAHIENTNYSKWAEVGYEEFYNAQGGKSWEVFTEGGIGNTVLGPDWGLFLTSGRTDQFKVNNVAGTTKFNFWVNYGSGWVQAPSGSNLVYDVNFSKGEPMGETARNATGAGVRSNFTGLQYKTSSGSWTAWPSNFDSTSVGNGIPGWGYYYYAPTQFQICQTTVGC